MREYTVTFKLLSNASPEDIAELTQAMEAQIEFVSEEKQVTINYTIETGGFKY